MSKRACWGSKASQALGCLAHQGTAFSLFIRRADLTPFTSDQLSPAVVLRAVWHPQGAGQLFPHWLLFPAWLAVGRGRVCQRDSQRSLCHFPSWNWPQSTSPEVGKPGHFRTPRENFSRSGLQGSDLPTTRGSRMGVMGPLQSTSAPGASVHLKPQIALGFQVNLPVVLPLRPRYV